MQASNHKALNNYMLIQHNTVLFCLLFRKVLIRLHKHNSQLLKLVAQYLLSHQVKVRLRLCAKNYHVQQLKVVGSSYKMYTQQVLISFQSWSRLQKHLDKQEAHNPNYVISIYHLIKISVYSFHQHLLAHSHNQYYRHHSNALQSHHSA